MYASVAVEVAVAASAKLAAVAEAAAVLGHIELSSLVASRVAAGREFDQQAFGWDSSGRVQV